MNERGKSDRPVVPVKPANKADGRPTAAEPVEGRGLAKGNSNQQNRSRTPSRNDLYRELDRVRQATNRRVIVMT